MKIRSAFKLVVWTLLAFYTLLQTSRDLLHNAQEQKKVVHSALAEKNSCHRSVYHGEKDGHKSHLTPLDFCPWCHLSSSPCEIHSEGILSVDLAESGCLVAHNNAFPETEKIFSRPVRGPPHQLI